MNKDEILKKAKEDRTQLLAYLDDDETKKIVLEDVTCVANLFSEKAGPHERRILEIDDIYQAIRKCPEALNKVHIKLIPGIAAVLLDDEYVDRFALFFSQFSNTLEFFRVALESLIEDKEKIALLVSKPIFMKHVLDYIESLSDDVARAESIVQVLSQVKAGLRNGVFESLRTRKSKRLLADIGKFIENAEHCVLYPELISFFIENRANEVLPHIAKAFLNSSKLFLQEINKDTCRAEVISQHFEGCLTRHFTGLLEIINDERDKRTYARAVRNIVVASISEVSDMLLSEMKKPKHVPLVLVVLTAYLSAIRADDKDANTPFENLFKQFLNIPDLNNHFKSQNFLTLLRHLYLDGPADLKPLLLRNEAFVDNAVLEGVGFSDQVQTMLSNVLEYKCQIPTVLLNKYQIPLRGIIWRMLDNLNTCRKPIETIFTVHPELCNYIKRNQLLQLINHEDATNEFIQKLVESLAGDNRTTAMNELVGVCFRKVKNPHFFEELFKIQELVHEAASTIFYPNRLLATKSPVLLEFLKEDSQRCSVLPENWHNIDLGRVAENQEVPKSQSYGRFGFGCGEASTYMTSSESALKVY